MPPPPPKYRPAPLRAVLLCAVIALAVGSIAMPAGVTRLTHASPLAASSPGWVALDDALPKCLGGEGFKTPRSYPAHRAPGPLVSGDWNGDTLPDLAVGNEDSNDISILFSNADDSFQVPHNYPIAERPVSLAVGDFNRDTHPDLATANFIGNTVSVLLGNADGTFQPAATYPSQQVAVGIASGDFNHDGASDLAVAHRDSNDVSVVLSNSDGTF